MSVEVPEAGQLLPGVPVRDGATEWFGHPRGLTILFLTEMWERFSFYGMRSLLIYYMMKELLMRQEQASLIYGIYTAFVFFTPIVGGLLADRWLGRRRSVLIGGPIMALGHFMMAFEPLFGFALATIGLGNGLFLPSLPSQIHGLYSPEDPRRHTAYNSYYVGINLGALLAPLVCGTIGEVYGWHWGFTAAGVGMIAGLAIYICGSRYLPPDAPYGHAAAPHGSQRVLQHPEAQSGRTFILRRFALLASIAGIAVVFRAAYEQVGNTLPLWIESAERSVAGFVIPMTWFQSLNPLLILAFTPFVVAHWLRLARQGREPSSILKMAMGAGVTAISYLMLAGIAAWSDSHGISVSWIWLLAFFIVMTVGELYILPVGLGLFGRLAPEGFSATSIALWFLAAFAGNLAAGMLGTCWSRLSPASFFAITAAVAGASAVLLMFFNATAQRTVSE
jgi:POT family proton-dependent oligopeptide transporter